MYVKVSEKVVRKEMESSSREKVELIQQTIQRLITDDDGDSDSSSDGNEVNVPGELNRRGRRRLVLTGLLSQVYILPPYRTIYVVCN